MTGPNIETKIFMINKVMKKMTEDEKKGLFRMLQLPPEHLLVNSRPPSVTDQSRGPSPDKSILSGPNYNLASQQYARDRREVAYQRLFEYFKKN